MKIIGLMSGTSLDGVDLALCDITEHGYTVLDATTVPYPAEWRSRLATIEHGSALDYALTHVELGHYMGCLVRDFISGHTDIEAVASHGHTVFHQPDRGLTAQIGDADAIAAECGIPVVSGFRTLDVALGGQGAPLVPIGDELLFGEYDACLNLGGFANISYRLGNRRIAFDICPCNMALNKLSARLGLDYDPQGSIAASGHVHTCLKAQLDALDYYSLPAPKSLGKEWFESNFWPLLAAAQIDTADLLATVCAHIAGQTARARGDATTMLVTGGGAFNDNLVDTIRQYCPQTVVTVPDALTVNYKEAIIFALLGYLRLTRQVNTLQSVTGARRDSCGGSVSGC